MRNIKFIAVILLAALTFTSCKNDDDLETINVSSKNIALNNISNPFEIVGEEHNAMLNDFANSVKLDDYTINDLYLYNLSKGYITSAISYDSFYSQTVNGGQFMLNYILSDQDLMYNLTQDKEIAYYMGQVKEIFTEMIQSNKEMAPEAFAKRINTIEAEIMDLNLYDKGDINNKELNKYSMLLSSLSIARHSYSFWYDAFYNEENPWHNLMVSRLNDVGTKGAFGDFFKGIGNALVSVGKAVVAVVAFVPADIGGAFYYGFENMQDFKMTFDIHKMKNGGANTSMSVGRWGFGY